MYSLLRVSLYKNNDQVQLDNKKDCRCFVKYLEQLFAFDFIKGSLLNPSAREVIEHIDSTYLVIVLLYKFNSCFFLLLNIQLVNSVVLKNR